MSKKLVGGVFLLCLTAMALTLSEDGETYINITQPEILEQLTNLKNYVSEPKMIKPVWVQLKNGDEIVVVQGELKVVDTGEFEICVQLNGYKLVISIEFTQATLDDDTPIDDWYIAENDAKYLFTTDVQNINALVNAGEIDNAKPIYFHPIRFDINGQTAGQTMFVKSGSIMILNNDATPLNTFKKLRDYLYNHGDGIDILCSIDIFDNDGYAGQILSITGGGTDESPVISLSFTTNGQATTDGILGVSEFIVISDLVNKIN